MRIHPIASATGLAIVLCSAAVAHGKGGAKKAGAAPTGVWKSLVQANAKWTLSTSPEAGQAAHKILVETYDVRKVGDAAVARLRFFSLGSLGKNGAAGKKEALPSLGEVPTQVAVNDRGAWFLKREDDDAAVAAALAGKPTQPDPPRAMKSTQRKDGKLVDLRKLEKGEVVCVGFGPARGAGECGDVCFGDFCVSATAGLVMIEGTYAPNDDVYSQSGW